jgi:hypothetical protein
LTPAPTIATRLERVAPQLLVAVPVLFNLWVLRAETTVVQNTNDSHLHLAMVRWARGQILEGKVPLDGWFPYLGLGYAQFRHYSSLPHILTAYASLLDGATVTYFWSLYLLLALWPISVYLGTRLLGWDRWTAAGAGLVSAMLVSASSYGFEQGSYTWYGYGLWAQLWGMWLLPIALGFAWRAVSGKGHYALAALAVALTIASHLVLGYFAALAIGVFALVTPRQIVAQLGRAIVVAIGAVLAGAWIIVPLFQDAPWHPVSEFGRGNSFDLGFGAAQVFKWLVAGSLYDNGRVPIVSALVGVGLVVCLLRFWRDERARAIVTLWLLSLALMSGSATFGVVLRFLPGSSNLPWHRFIAGVHATGVVLAGIGIAWLGRKMVGLARRFVPRLRPQLAVAAAMALAVLALFPGWSQEVAGDETSARARSTELLYESSDGADLRVLIDDIKTLGGGRAYAGGRWAWGQDYRVGYVPVNTILSNEDIDAVGLKLRVSSLMTDIEMIFDEKNPAHYDLFNVRFLLLPGDMSPPVKAALIAQQGRHKLWRVDTSGYLEVVDTTWPPIVEDRTNVASRNVGFLASDQLAHQQYPTVAYDGGDAAGPTLPPGVTATGPAGQVLNDVSSPEDGIFKADVVANRRAFVLLKVSYDPRWRVTVDGVDAPTEMVAPALMGTTVAAGRHTISFQYVSDPEYPLLLGAGALALAGLAIGPRRLPGLIALLLGYWRRRRRRKPLL